MNRLTLLLLLMPALSARAFEPAVVKIAVKIESDTIGQRMEIDKSRRGARMNEAQKIVAATVASELNELFSFVKWLPAHEAAKGDSSLTITVREESEPRNRYVIDYERAVGGEKKVSGKVDWGDNDPLFKPEEDKPLGNAVRLGARVAEKVAQQMKRKRQHVMTAFLSRIALCHHKPRAARDRTFTIDVPLETIKASEESKVEITFWAKPNARGALAEGMVQLSPLRACKACDGPTLGMFKSFFFPGIGPLEQWSEDILPLFGASLLDHAFLYMVEYRSTDDSSQPSRSTEYED